MHGHYTGVIQRVREYIDANATTPEIREKAENAFERFQAGYTKRFAKWVSARSRCASSAVVGPSGFPVARANKANDRDHNAQGEVHAYESKWQRVFERICNPDTYSIRTEDPEAVEKIEARAEAIQSRADRMVELNKLFRTIRKRHDDDAPAFAELFDHCTEAERKEILSNITYSWCKDRPYPPYAISNARANQRRYEQRAEYVAKVQALDSAEWEGANARVVDNTDANRIQIFFPGKPDEETRSKLKRNGFRWAPSEGAWQAYRTYAWTLTFAKEIAGVECS